MAYLWLVVLWLLFGLLHSIFAATAFKQVAKVVMKNSYKYYRPIYSIFATVNLAAVIWYHYSINSELLWNNSVIEKTIAIILSIPALVVMGISIKKYFLDLSGIDVFLKQRPIKPLHLELGGLHRYVRHPLYFGTLLFVWSIFLWQPSVANIISCICITLYTIIGTYFEEKKLVMMFGEAYVTYRKRVPMLVPGL
jgi:protein-S-isoprenylcysteine O-methyltransferase Ste14